MVATALYLAMTVWAVVVVVVEARARAATAWPVALGALCAMALGFTARVAPARFEGWMTEDGWAEWATVVAFAGAGGLYARLLRKPASILQRLGWFGLGAFCLFVAGEELSWGQRLFSVQPPEVFLRENYQQELNVHNLLTGRRLAGMQLDTRFLVAFVAVVVGVLAPLAARGARRACGPADRLLRAAPPLALSPLFALVALIEIDYPAHLVGETAELLLGLAFLGSAVAATDRLAPLATRYRGLLLGAPALALAVGLIVATALDSLLTALGQREVPRALAELHQLAAEVAGVRAHFEQETRRFATVHKRVFTAQQAGYLKLDRAPPSADDEAVRHAYFLDPWNNPWWVHFDRGQGSLRVYSFGPNRRRDSDIENLGPPLGDDLVVEVGR